MLDLIESPTEHLLFASLHVLAGHVGSALLHRARFKRNPLVLYSAVPSPHQRRTRLVSIASLAWAFTLVATTLSGSFRSHILTRSLLDDRSSISTVGWVLAVLGLLVMTISQASMGAEFRVGQNEADAPEQLRQTGVHAWSRNPIYLGSWVYLLGMSFWYPSPLLLTLCLIIGAGIHSLVLAEEDFLRARFGDVFARYEQRTPRYVGWVQSAPKSTR